jgi:Flp pilus assembly protein TadG
MELMLVLPILLGLFLAIVEFSMLWSANQRVKLAANAGARVATFPGSNPLAVEQAIVMALNKQSLISTMQFYVQGGQCTGDPVVVRVAVPMQAAAPDMLSLLGFSLGNRQLAAETIMRKE